MPIKTIELDLSRFADQVDMLNYLATLDIYSVIELHPNSPRVLLEQCLQQFPQNLYLKFNPNFAKDELQILIPLIKSGTSFIPNALHFSEILPLFNERIYFVADESQGLFFSPQECSAFLIEAHPYASPLFIIDLVNHLRDQIFYFHEATPVETMSIVLAAVDIKLIINKKSSIESQRMQIQNLRPKSSLIFFFQHSLEIMQPLLPMMRPGCRFEIATTDAAYLKDLVACLPKGVIYCPLSSIPLDLVKESLKDLKIGTLFEPSSDLSSESYHELCQTYAFLQAQKVRQLAEPKKKKAKLDNSPSIKMFFQPIDTSQSSSGSKSSVTLGSVRSAFDNN